MSQTEGTLRSGTGYYSARSDPMTVNGDTRQGCFSCIAKDVRTGETVWDSQDQS